MRRKKVEKEESRKSNQKGRKKSDERTTKEKDRKKKIGRKGWEGEIIKDDDGVEVPYLRY